GSRAAKLLSVDEYTAVVERAVDSIEQRALLLVAQVMYRQRRNYCVVFLLDPVNAIVGDFEAKSLTGQFEARTGAFEHLARNVHHRDSRIRKTVRDKRGHQARAGAEIENFDTALARKLDQVDRRPVEVIESRHQATPRAVVILRCEIERVLY